MICVACSWWLSILIATFTFVSAVTTYQFSRRPSQAAYPKDHVDSMMDENSAGFHWVGSFASIDFFLLLVCLFLLFHFLCFFEHAFSFRLTFLLFQSSSSSSTSLRLNKYTKYNKYTGQSDRLGIFENQLHDFCNHSVSSACCGKTTDATTHYNSTFFKITTFTVSILVELPVLSVEIFVELTLRTCRASEPIGAASYVPFVAAQVWTDRPVDKAKFHE